MGNETDEMTIRRYPNGFWYVVDEKANAAVAIKLAREDAEAKCREEGWAFKIAEEAA